MELFRQGGGGGGGGGGTVIVCAVYGDWLYSRTFLGSFGSVFQFVCPPLGMHGLVTKIMSEIERVYLLHLCSAISLYWLLSRNLKPRLLIFRNFHEN